MSRLIRTIKNLPPVRKLPACNEEPPKGCDKIPIMFEYRLGDRYGILYKIQYRTFVIASSKKTMEKKAKKLYYECLEYFKYTTIHDWVSNPGVKVFKNEEIKINNDEPDKGISEKVPATARTKRPNKKSVKTNKD